MYGSFRSKLARAEALSTTVGSRASSVAVGPAHTKPSGSTAYQPPGQPSVPTAWPVGEELPARRYPRRSELAVGRAWIQARSALAWMRGAAEEGRAAGA